MEFPFPPTFFKLQKLQDLSLVSSSSLLFVSDPYTPLNPFMLIFFLFFALNFTELVFKQSTYHDSDEWLTA